MMAYSVLKFCIRECTYTIMGDVSQNIHFGYGLNDWEELKGLLLSGERDSFGILKKATVIRWKYPILPQISCIMDSFPAIPWSRSSAMGRKYRYSRPQVMKS